MSLFWKLQRNFGTEVLPEQLLEEAMEQRVMDCWGPRQPRSSGCSRHRRVTVLGWPLPTPHLLPCSGHRVALQADTAAFPGGWCRDG